MKNVILFYPHADPELVNSKVWHRCPLSIMALAPKLIKKGYRVYVIDERVNRKAYQKVRLLLANAVCVGITALTGFQIKKGIEFAKFIRSLSRIKIVWGGWHVSLLPEESIKSKWIDIIVRGQGEETFKELVIALDNHEDLNKIKGITYQKDNEIISTPDREIIPLNDLEPMLYDLIDIQKYYPSFSYYSSRGCPNDCGFCAIRVVYKRCWSGIDGKRVAREIMKLIPKLPKVEKWCFDDDNFFVNKKRVFDFYKEILKYNSSFKHIALGHPAQLARAYSTEDYKMFKKGGLEEILIGAESGSQEMLDFINKKATVDDIITVARKTKAANIRVNLSFMCGFPQAPLDDLKDPMKLIDICKKINPLAKIKLFFFNPYPGSKLYYIAIREGFKPPRTLEDWSNYTLRQRNMPYLDPEYERMVRYFVSGYFPKYIGQNTAFSYKHFVDKYNRNLNGKD